MASAARKPTELEPSLRDFLLLRENLHDLISLPTSYGDVLRRVLDEIEEALPHVHKVFKASDIKANVFFSKLLIFTIQRPSEAFLEIDKLAGLDERLSLPATVPATPQTMSPMSPASVDTVEMDAVGRILLRFESKMINSRRHIGGWGQQPYFSREELSCLSGVLLQYVLKFAVVSTDSDEELRRKKSLLTKQLSPPPTDSTPSMSSAPSLEETDGRAAF
ncbi:unnamed protein product [Vitrella brassicaformis CCMP3155]|uniref:Uncharacterized protein n=1 Tax=Vitrella brassicaformis (strain CCMP3155) TaxID=1169540 RepID=A0A0G4GT50_VITBC|nr:unnamed protein product [Vitrella brassicaformis CCMP3155]|eukprot:CEM33871.1 unnamed protein product [Vitrella brassicaformis CCMP3155]